MHIEIQVALNFVINYLYNKLPRRRVNLFGEELERALRDKFNGHWYPEKPVRGSAYRCIKTGSGPVDPVLERAARESGIPVQDILENLPQELAVWVDPAEVSCRIGEKGAVRILYSETSTSCNVVSPNTPTHDDDLDTEVRKTFNPDAQCFRPIQNALGNLNLGPSTTKTHQANGTCVSPYQGSNVRSPASPPPTSNNPTTSSVASVASVQSITAAGTLSPVPQTAASSAPTTFLGRPTAPPLTFTTATFAQTKFGSTKLKTSSKRANRMSPTEFSNYIKQRAIQQQQQQQAAQQNASAYPGSRPRSLSPHPSNHQNSMPPQTGNPENYFFSGRPYLQFPATQYPHPQHPLQSDMHFSAAPQHHNYLENETHYFHHMTGSNGVMLPPVVSAASASSPSASVSPGGTMSAQTDTANKQQLLDGLNFGLNYQSGQYQHLLVAN